MLMTEHQLCPDGDWHLLCVDAAGETLVDLGGAEPQSDMMQLLPAAHCDLVVKNCPPPPGVLSGVIRSRPVPRPQRAPAVAAEPAVAPAVEPAHAPAAEPASEESVAGTLAAAPTPESPCANGADDGGAADGDGDGDTAAGADDGTDDGAGVGVLPARGGVRGGGAPTGAPSPGGDVEMVDAATMEAAAEAADHDVACASASDLSGERAPSGAEASAQVSAEAPEGLPEP